MKDRIGQSSKPKKRTPPPQEPRQTATAPRPASQPSYQSATPPKKSGGGAGPKIAIAVAAVAVVAVGGFFAWKQFGSGGGGGGGLTPPAAVTSPKVEYPAAGDGITPEMQDEMDLMFQTKKIAPPSLTALEDYIKIRELHGPLESAADGKNAMVKADATVTGGGAEKAQNAKNNINGDTVGWMYMPNTNVDYAVVQSRQDNNYYVNKGYNKQYSKDGVIWTDFRANSDNSKNLSSNNIIFGHNWNNIYKPARTLGNAKASDVMFSLVPSYTHLDFAQQNPFIYYSTLDKDMTWQVFATFFTDLSFDYVYPDPKRDLYQNILAEAIAKSEFNYNVPVSTEDKIITLSTCTRVYGNTDNQRYVVMAKLVKEGTPSTLIATHTNMLPYNKSVS